MSRIRSIKPEFFIHEGLAELPAATRLLFIGLWTLADKEGRLEDRPKRIKAQVFPYEDLNIEDALAVLDVQGHIHRYQVDGINCIDIPGFLEHQRPHPKETSYNLPPPPSREISRQAGKFHGKPGKETASREKDSPCRVVVGDGDGGGCGNGEQPLSAVPADLAESGAELSDVKADEKPSGAPARAAQARQVFEHWRTTMGKNGSTVFDKKRRRVVEARLKDGYPLETLLRAVDGCKASPFHQGQNDRQKVFDDLELICRDAKHVDEFVALIDSPAPRVIPDVRTGFVRAEDCEHPAEPGYIDPATFEVRR